MQTLEPDIRIKMFKLGLTSLWLFTQFSQLGLIMSIGDTLTRREKDTTLFITNVHD